MIKSTMKLPTAGMDFSTRVKLNKRNAAGSSSGTLFYQSVCGSQRDDRRFGEVVLSVNVKDFKTYFEHISEGVNDSDGSIHNE